VPCRAVRSAERWSTVKQITTRAETDSLLDLLYYSSPTLDRWVHDVCLLTLLSRIIASRMLTTDDRARGSVLGRQLAMLAITRKLCYASGDYWDTVMTVRGLVDRK